MEPEGYKHMFKLIVIGNSGCGKSCLLRMFTESTFNNNHNMTIGVEFGSRIISLDDTKLKLQIWDTAGQESFRSITRSYYRGSVGAVVVFDLTSRESFEDSKTWFSDVKELTKTDVSILLVGNKSDLTSHREVNEEEAKDFAKENDMEYIETSAKTAENVDSAFFSVAKSILKKIQEGKIDPATLGGGTRGRSGSKKASGPGGGGSSGNNTENSSNNNSKVNIGSENNKKDGDGKDKKCCN